MKVVVLQLATVGGKVNKEIKGGSKADEVEAKQF